MASAGLRGDCTQGYVNKSGAKGTIVRAAAKSATGRVAPKYGRGTGIPDPIDIHVGKRVRIRRLLLGMNQETLADAVGLTFQQVQKYEADTNRVSASRLSALAGILGAPISYFFADLPSANAKVSAKDRAERERLERPESRSRKLLSQRNRL